MKVAVTGGTGFVGRNLVARLLEDNHEVTVLSHRKSGEGIFGPKVRIVNGSVSSITEMVPAFQGVQIVFHLVGIIAETRSKTFDKTVAEGSRNLVAACKEGKVKKIVYLSALGTTENAETAYHRTKFLAEQSIKNSGLEWTIFRSSVIYGKDDGFLRTMSKVIKLLPFVPVFGDGKYKLQPVYIGDLAEAIAKSVQIPTTNSEIINVGGPEELEYEEVLSKIKNALGKSRLNFHIPFGVIRPIAAVMEKILKPSPLTTDMLKMLKMGNTGEITKLRAILGVEPVNFEDGLKRVFGDN